MDRATLNSYARLFRVRFYWLMPKRFLLNRILKNIKSGKYNEIYK